MPTLEKVTPELAPKSLARRKARQQAVLVVTKATMPGKMALSLRREVTKLHADIMAAKDPKDVCALVSSAVSARNQLLDILGWPKRPTAPQVKPGRLPPPVDITPETIQEAAEVTPSAQVASPE